jgi:deoxyribose-phosphate aldolase
VAFLLRAVSCIDLTTLAGDDTPSNVARLTAKALNPVERDTLTALGVEKRITCGAVCVYPNRVKDAVRGVKGEIPIASVATGRQTRAVVVAAVVVVV